jgi:uncharacterized protein
MINMERRALTLTSAVALAAILLAGIALAAPAIAGNARPSNGAPTANGAPSDVPVRTINVHGTGRVTVVPDMATVILGVVEQSSTAGAAQSAAAAKMVRVVASLRKDGIAEADIQTMNIGLNPVYDYSNNTQKLTGYEAAQSVQVKIRKLADTGRIVDNAVAAGASQIQSISLSASNPTAATAQARAAAVADAKAKAQGLAGAAGNTLGRARIITESSSGYTPPIPFNGGAGAPDKAVTPIMAGTVDITVDVDIAYDFE